MADRFRVENDESFYDICLSMAKNKKPVVVGTITESDYLKAQRRAARLEEIALHGRPVSFRKAVHRSKKTYSRKGMKSGLVDE